MDEASDISMSTPQHKTDPRYVSTPFDTPQVYDNTFSQYEKTILEEADTSPKEKLNIYLASCDVSPVCSSINTLWDEASARTKRHYVRKAKQVVKVTLEEIAPKQ